MKQIELCLLCLALMAGLVSCSDKEPGVEPHLSQYELQMFVGDRMSIEVFDASEISAQAGSQLITVGCDGNKVNVVAMAAGQSAVYVKADGHRLQCNVTITEKPEGSADYDYTDELNDAMSRYKSSTIKLGYDEPGTMFRKESGRYVVAGLDSGNIVELMFDGDCEVGEMNNVSLTENGKPVVLRSANIMQVDERGVWFLFVDANGCQIVMVVTDL